jgi:hypothetical protein
MASLQLLVVANLEVGEVLLLNRRVRGIGVQILPAATRSQSMFRGAGLPILVKANVVRRKVG